MCVWGGWGGGGEGGGGVCGWVVVVGGGGGGGAMCVSDTAVCGRCHAGRCAAEWVGGVG